MSPQDDRVTAKAAARRFSNPVERRVQYGSEMLVRREKRLEEGLER